VEQLVRDFMRAVRGDRSQVAFSRRAGCASNVAAQWESGRRVPSAATALSACARVGIDVSAAFDRFHRATAALIRIRGKGPRSNVDPKSIADWLRAHTARTRATEIAERAGISTFKLSRILNGKTGVNLADFFVLVRVMTDRLSDLIAVLVDITEVPSVALVHAELEASRALAFSDPWTSAVLALLETKDHLSGQQPSAEFLSERLGLDAATVDRALGGLASAGLILERAGKYSVRRALTIDTRGHPEATLRLRRHWARVGAERLASPGPRDLFAYNVFSISRADFERIREREQQYFREARAIIAASTDSEVAGLLTVQLFQWDDTRERG
jgi:DNA-binding MarR family transcriptional regulator